MRLWLELLQTDERRRTEAIAALTQCTQTLSRIVHDLLDTARALSGKLSVMLEPASPASPSRPRSPTSRPWPGRRAWRSRWSSRRRPWCRRIRGGCGRWCPTCCPTP
ncbi:hypothetical protein ACN28S_40160 [Cystobacter fuscus]